MTNKTVTKKQTKSAWRTIDIIVTCAVAVACGVVFWAWDQVYDGIGGPLGSVLPGLKGLLSGVWLIAGPLAGLIVRKPGAALAAEIVAATVEALLGSQWGATVLYAGFLQGLGAELGLMAFKWQKSGFGAGILAGAFAGVACSISDGFTHHAQESFEFFLVYVPTTILSGAIIAGALMVITARGLAATGALNRFAIAHEK